MEKFTKQIYEEFTINADFSKNMATTEIISSQTASAVDKDGDDKSSTVLDIGTLANDGAQTVSVLVRAGLEAEQPYQITIKCETDAGHKWELDVQMKIKEI